MNLDDSKPLLVFATVLEAGSMQAAAQLLGMTPSAVSQHITRLEALHQVKLLHRSTRRLTPTDAGLALRTHCQHLRHALEQARETLASLKTEATGELHLALTSSMVEAPAFCRSLARLRQQYPRIQPVLHISDTLAQLGAEEIDIAIRGGDHALDAPGLVARHLTRWHWRILAAPDYLARHPAIHTPHDLLQHAWLHFRHAPRQLTLHHGDSHQHLQLPGGLRCDQLASLRSLAMAGLGLCLQLGEEARTHIDAGRLCVVLPQWQLPSVNLYAVTPHRAQSAKVRVALEILHQCFAAPATA